ncbi:MAG: hypothetical protein ABFD25_10660 [Clostridiaceae bacterium]
MKDNNMDLPNPLEKTYKMLTDAFPNGIEDNEYFPLLGCLYHFMCDENLAKVIAKFTKKDYAFALNDVYRSASTDKPSKDEIDGIKTKLSHFGFDDWAKNIDIPD